MCLWVSRVSSCSNCSQSRRGDSRLFFLLHKDGAAPFTRCISLLVGLVFRVIVWHCFTIYTRSSFHVNNNNNNDNNSVSFVTKHMAYFLVFGSNGFVLTLNNGWNFSGSILHFRRCCCCTPFAKLSFKRFSCPHWSSAPPPSSTNSHCWRPRYCWHLIHTLRPDFR